MVDVILFALIVGLNVHILLLSTRLRQAEQRFLDQAQKLIDANEKSAELSTKQAEEIETALAHLEDIMRVYAKGNSSA